jgi:hypothetical protein
MRFKIKFRSWGSRSLYFGMRLMRRPRFLPSSALEGTCSHSVIPPPLDPPTDPRRDGNNSVSAQNISSSVLKYTVVPRKVPYLHSQDAVWRGINCDDFLMMSPPELLCTRIVESYPWQNLKILSLAESFLTPEYLPNNPRLSIGFDVFFFFYS